MLWLILSQKNLPVVKTVMRWTYKQSWNYSPGLTALDVLDTVTTDLDELINTAILYQPL